MKTIECADSKVFAASAEKANFPTDLYILEGLIRTKGGGYKLVLLDDPVDLMREKVDLDRVAVVLLTHVAYNTGRMLDMEGITSAVHQR